MTNPYQVVDVGCLGNQMVDLTLHTERLALKSFLLPGDEPLQPVLHILQVNFARLLVSTCPGLVGQQRVQDKGPQDGHYQFLLSPHHTQANLTGQSEWTLNTNRTEGVDLLKE